MIQQQQQWSPFHTGQMTNEREQDARDLAAQCNHTYDRVPTNPQEYHCTQCQHWIFRM